MASYPTFAFFDTRPSLRAVADALDEALAHELPNRRAEDHLGVVVDHHAEPAVILLGNGNDSLEASLLEPNMVMVELSDFPSALYDTHGVTADSISTKRAIALRVHEVLLRLTARVSYTSRYDNQGDNDHLGRAERFARAPQQVAEAIREEPSYFWLYGTSDVLAQVLHSRFEVVEENDTYRVSENRDDKPLFMNLR